ncbi:beta-4C adrenergic receptor-like [Montipora foliosa]|uniref:beta-4C adrenergic receptor-like n=1 Tax=Montipora foliosa TaxID=591990 RepID=UPI0035F1164A
MQTVFYIVLCVINGIFSLTAVLGNFATLGAIWKSPSLHSQPSNAFIFGLAMSDFGVGLIVQPAFIVCLINEYTQESRSRGTAWTVFKSTQAVFVAMTVLTLTLVSLDRVAALTFHLKYNCIVTFRRACSALCLTFITSIAYGISLPLFKFLHGVLSTTIVSSCLVINLLAYLVIFRISRRHHLAIQAQAVEVNQQSGSTFNMNRYRKSVISMLRIFILFILCYLPYNFVRVCLNFEVWNPPLPRDTVLLALRFSGSLVYANSSLNPLLYCWRIRELRLGMKGFMKSLC